MAKLQECGEKLTGLLAEALEASNAYHYWRGLLAAIDEGKPVDLSQMVVQVSMASAPPVTTSKPTNPEEVAYLVAAAVSSLGMRNVEIWNQIFAVAQEGHHVCQQAVAQAQQQPPMTANPPAMTAPTAPAGNSGVAPNLSPIPPQPMTIPKLNPIPAR